MDTNQRDIRLAAMNLLAMREHSVSELREKLSHKFPLHPAINSVLEALVEQDLVSDKRFTESFISMRFRQLKGPLLIALELKSKGVAPGLVESCMANAGLDWNEAAQKLREKKFGALNPIDVRERAKQVRHMQSRGFTGEQIRHAFLNESS